jgi:hypothetical protein
VTILKVFDGGRQHDAGLDAAAGADRHRHHVVHRAPARDVGRADLLAGPRPRRDHRVRRAGAHRQPVADLRCGRDSRISAAAIRSRSRRPWHALGHLAQASVARRLPLGACRRHEWRARHDGQIGNTNLGPLIIQAGNLVDGAVTTAKISAAALDATKFASSIQPIGIVSAVPGSLTLRTVFNTTDGACTSGTAPRTSRRRRQPTSPANSPTRRLPPLRAAKVTGQITGTQITDGAISTPKLAAGAVQAAQHRGRRRDRWKDRSGFDHGERNRCRRRDGAELAAGSVVAGKIAAGAVTATEIAAGAITASKIVVTGRGAALNDDPACVDNSAWITDVGRAARRQCTPSSIAPGGHVLRLTNTGRVHLVPTFPIIHRQAISSSCWARQVSGGGTFYFLLATGQLPHNVASSNLGYEGVTLALVRALLGIVDRADCAVKAT